jgi:hypothetical protein
MIGSKFNEAYLQIIKEDYDNGMENLPEVTPDEKPLKRVTFLTSDEALIEALGKGVEEVVFFVKSEDEENIEEIKFGKDSFGELAIEDEAETDEEDTETEEEITEEEEITDDGGEEITEEEEITDDGGEEITEDAEEKSKDCRHCHGTGSLKSYCDEPDRTCHFCNGTGYEESVEPLEDDDMAVEEDDIAVECNEWLEDGVCVKCQSTECDGSCKCEKCGEVNCIGDCQ